MADSGAFDALLDDMQAASLGLISWETVLHAISRLLGVPSAGIHKDLWQGGGWGFYIDGDDSTFSDYFRHYAGIHPLALRTTATPAGLVLTDRMIMPRSEFERSEFYHDWARPNGFDQHLHVRLENDGHALVGLSVTRPRCAREFGAAELRLARRMAPHLRRAVATYERFEEVRQANSGLMEALDRMRRGVFGLGADGRVVFANETARTVLARGGALRMDQGVLAATRADQTRMIHRLVGSVARGEVPAVLTIERPDGRAPLRLEPVCLGGVARMTDLRPPMLILLLVHDPEIETDAAVALLRGRYGLTATEAAVASHTARGKGVAAVAAALGIGQGTVRSHLKRVFDKTQTNRQAELAWLVSSVGKWPAGR